MPESIQHKLDRVRRPRVQITYDVETLGSIVKTELPFVVGIMADLSGYERRPGETNPTALKDRKFVEIDRDNFDQIMEKVGPQVKPEGLTDPLGFKSLEDFEPKNVLNNILPLREKFERRTRLSNLLAKLDGNPGLQKNLMEAIRDLIADNNEKAAFQKYINVSLRHKEGQEQETPFDADALFARLSPAQQKVVRAYIVERYPDTVTPDTLTLYAAVADADKPKLKAQMLEQYPYAVKPDAAALAAAITDNAQKAKLLAFIQAAPPDGLGVTGATDLATAIPALTPAQQSAVKAKILKEFPDAVKDADVDPTLLKDADQDELKEFILSDLDVGSVQVKTPKEGIGKVQLPTLMKSLKAHEKKELTAYVEKNILPPAENTEGGAS